jgi:integrase
MARGFLMFPEMLDVSGYLGYSGPHMDPTTLTASKVDALKVPVSGRTDHWDAKVSGFGLRLSPSGKAWFIRYRLNGRRRRIVLGRFPAMSLADARAAARKLLGQVAAGADPAEAKTDAKHEATLQNLVDAYMQRHAEPHKRTAWQDRKVLGRYLPSTWYTRRLSTITRDEVVELHARVGRDHGHYAANRLLALLRTMLNLARDWNLLKGDNPAIRIKLFKEEKRERFLSPEEVRRLNDALLDEPNPYWKAYFPLALMLGTRRAELLSVRWENVDLEARTLRLPETKAGRSHLLPLPGPAIELLQSLPSRGQGEFVFPGPGACGHLVEPAKAWQRIRRRANLTDARIHDLRRTLGSWLASAGYSLPLIGKALNHSQPATTAIYARLDLDPVREALERNAALVTAR